jgi:hypothetical protein
MPGWLIGLLIVYAFATLIYLGVLWDRAYKHHLIHGSPRDFEIHVRRKRRAARMTLGFPFWLLWLFLELLWWLLKTAWGVKKKVEVSPLLCPECRQKMSRGPNR